jgi:hypothetical protein
MTLRVEGMSAGDPAAEVGHGNNCVVLSIESTPRRNGAATMLTPDAAEQLGMLLIRQADYARAAAGGR